MTKEDHRLKPKPRVVQIDWVDSARTAGWHSKSRGELFNCFSLGMLVGETRETVTISTSKTEEGDWVDQLTIPKCSIKKMRTVRV